MIDDPPPFPATVQKALEQKSHFVWGEGDIVVFPEDKDKPPFVDRYYRIEQCGSYL